MTYNFPADVVLLLAEQYETKSNEKFGWFRSRPTCLATAEELWYNETVRL